MAQRFHESRWNPKDGPQVQASNAIAGARKEKTVSAFVEMRKRLLETG